MFVWGTQDVMDLVNLIQLIFAWEQWEERQNLKKDTANTPDVHFIIVVAFGQETFGWTVPSGRNVFCMPLAFHAFAGSEIDELNFLIFKQNVFSKYYVKG